MNDKKNQSTKDIKIITTYSFSLTSESAIFTSDLLRSMVTVSGWPLSWFVKRPNIPTPPFIISFNRHRDLSREKFPSPSPFSSSCFFSSANARSGAACHCCWELCPDQTQRGFFPSLLFSEIELGQMSNKNERKQKVKSIPGVTCHGASDGRLDSPVPWSSHCEVCTWIHNTHCYWCSGWL